MGEDMKIYRTEVGKDYGKSPFKETSSQVVRFRVQAFLDCCVKLVGSEFNSLEVFIGGWGNKYSAIRLNGSGELVKEYTPNILSRTEFREFWIVWYNNELEVGRAGDRKPFLKTNVSLHNVLKIRKYGFATGNASGDFMFLEEREFVTKGDLKYHYEPLYGEVFSFNVSCAKDAHIILAMKLGDTDQKHEVIIGGEDNMYSAIKVDDKIVVRKETPNECTNSPKHYWINVRFKFIYVGRVGEEHAFLQYINPNPPFLVQHVGIATGSGAEGKWNLHF